jgi:hypothetical protein
VQAARAEVGAKESALKKAEARSSAAEQTLKEERSKEGSVHQFQQVCHLSAIWLSRGPVVIITYEAS